jgi:hypothetical protein
MTLTDLPYCTYCHTSGHEWPDCPETPVEGPKFPEIEYKYHRGNFSTSDAYNVITLGLHKTGHADLADDFRSDFIAAPGYAATKVVCAEWATLTEYTIRNTEPLEG